MVPVPSSSPESTVSSFSHATKSAAANKKAIISIDFNGVNAFTNFIIKDLNLKKRLLIICLQKKVEWIRFGNQINKQEVFINGMPYI